MLSGLDGVLETCLEQVSMSACLDTQVLEADAPCDRAPRPCDRTGNMATGSFSLNGAAATAAGTSIDATLDSMDEWIDAWLLARDVDERYLLLRGFVQQFMRHLHLGVCRHRLLLHLLARRLPLPTTLQPVTETHLMQGEELLQTIVEGMGSLESEIPTPTIAAPLCQDWCVPHLGPIGNYALDIMSFLEQGSMSEDLDEDSDIASQQSGGRGKPLAKRGDQGEQPHAVTLTKRGSQGREQGLRDSSTGKRKRVVKKKGLTKKIEGKGGDEEGKQDHRRRRPDPPTGHVQMALRDFLK